jgi:hypothetical protein
MHYNRMLQVVRACLNHSTTDRQHNFNPSWLGPSGRLPFSDSQPELITATNTNSAPASDIEKRCSGKENTDTAPRVREGFL